MINSLSEHDLRIKIQSTLNNRERKIIENREHISAAVIVPIFIKNDNYHIIYTKRSEHLNHHGGQISFPGGVKEKNENNLAATALRETYEELGILQDHVEISGVLDDFITGTGYIVTPFIGFIPYPYDFILNPQEVDAILEVPINFLLDKKNFMEDKDFLYKGTKYHYIAFKYENHTIWGATARITVNFLDLMYNWSYR